MSNPYPSQAPSPSDPVEVAEAQELAQTAQSAGQHFTNSMGSLHDLPDTLKGPLVQYLRRQQEAGEHGVQLMRMVSGEPQRVTRVDSTGRVVESHDYPRVGLRVPGGVENTLLTLSKQAQAMESDAQTEAQQLVAGVLLESAKTPAPMGASESQLASLKNDLTALLEAKPKPMGFREKEAARIIQDAVANGRNDILHVLLGDQMAFTRQRLGLDDVALAQVVFQARCERAKASIVKSTNISEDAWIGSPIAPKYARFLRDQFDTRTAIGAAAALNAAKLRSASKTLTARARRGSYR